MRNKIITDIYNTHLFERLASSYDSKLGDYKDDFIQQLYLFLCEMPEDKLIDLYNKGELNYYLYYVGKAFAFNDKSDFWKLHKGLVDLEFTLDNENYVEPEFDIED